MTIRYVMVVETMAVMVVLVTVKYPFPVNVSVLFTRRMACSRVSTSLRTNWFSMSKLLRKAYLKTIKKRR
jgi:hypothetical protein